MGHSRFHQLASFAVLLTLVVPLYGAEDMPATEPIDVGILFQPGWYIEPDPAAWSADDVPITFDAGGVRIGAGDDAEWLGRLFVEDGELVIRGGEGPIRVQTVNDEPGFLLMRLIFDDGRLVHFGRMHC